MKQAGRESTQPVNSHHLTGTKIYRSPGKQNERFISLISDGHWIFPVMLSATRLWITEFYGTASAIQNPATIYCIKLPDPCCLKFRVTCTLPFMTEHIFVLFFHWKLAKCHVGEDWWHRRSLRPCTRTRQWQWHGAFWHQWIGWLFCPMNRIPNQTVSKVKQHCSNTAQTKWETSDTPFSKYSTHICMPLSNCLQAENRQGFRGCQGTLLAANSTMWRNHASSHKSQNLDQKSAPRLGWKVQ